MEWRPRAMPGQKIRDFIKDEEKELASPYGQEGAGTSHLSLVRPGPEARDLTERHHHMLAALRPSSAPPDWHKPEEGPRDPARRVR
jgi:hypothetical protein